MTKADPGGMTESLFAETPGPPYYSVIFTARRTPGDEPAYEATSKRMLALAREQPGFLGVESAGTDFEITVSYWESLEAIQRWKAQAEHREAQQSGRERWYSMFRIRIARVENEHGMPQPHGT